MNSHTENNSVRCWLRGRSTIHHRHAPDHRPRDPRRRRRNDPALHTVHRQRHIPRQSPRRRLRRMGCRHEWRRSRSGSLWCCAVRQLGDDTARRMVFPPNSCKGLLTPCCSAPAPHFRACATPTPQSQMRWRKALRWRPATPCWLRPRSCSSDCWQH